MTSVQDPATDQVPVVPSDTVDLINPLFGLTGKPCRSLYIGVAGTIKVLTANKVARTIVVTAGYLYLQCYRVYETGTDADMAISACY